MQQNKPDKSGQNLYDKFSTLSIFFLLILTLVINTGEMIHGQLLRMGEKLYGDPATGMQYSFLRADPVKPDCNRHLNIDAEVDKQIAANQKDEFASFFGVATPDEIRASLVSAQTLCEEKYQFYDNANRYVEQHSSLKTYRTVETSFFWLFQFGTENRALLLVILVMIAAISATLHRHHIGLRPAVTKIDYRIHDIAMVIANVMLTYSCIRYLQSIQAAGVPVAAVTMAINYLWAVCFAVLAVISVYKLIKPEAAKQPGGSFGLALLAVPLYAYMAIISGIAFIFFIDYDLGQAIYLGQLAEFSNIFLSLALFIWVGMLLTQTHVMDLFLNILRPWNFSPETLTWFILIAAAVPTAYTGASGIFVVAAGAIIYKEVWNSGARRQYALAVSAMSGSLGVVVRPCLLVVLIAILDSRHVTSDELFDHGIYVFWMTAFLFLAVSLFFAESKFRVNPAGVAVPAMFRAMIPVIPYVLITAAILMFYNVLLDSHLNEFTAPVILPIILLAMVFFDKVYRKNKPEVYQANQELIAEHEKKSVFLQEHDGHDDAHKKGFWGSLNFATFETIGHIGALIILMALSVSVGGLIERTEVVHLLPSDIGNIYLALLFIAMLLAFIGMCTDPFGAVILVAASIAPVAYHNGIHPIHFWMICLVAFELGYVSPPVALNHLLTRLSIGAEEVMAADAEAKEKYTNFYYRYERWILPIIVMFPALMIVTFAPYIFGMFGWYK